MSDESGLTFKPPEKLKIKLEKLVAEYYLNNEEDLIEAMKNTKPVRGDVFICNDAMFERIKKYEFVKEPSTEPMMHRFVIEDMLKSKRASVDIRSDILEDVDTSSLLKTAYENLKKDDYPVAYHRYQIFSLPMSKYDEEVNNEDNTMKGKEWKGEVNDYI